MEQARPASTEVVDLLAVGAMYGVPCIKIDPSFKGETTELSRSFHRRMPFHRRFFSFILLRFTIHVHYCDQTTLVHYSVLPLLLLSVIAIFARKRETEAT